MPGDGCIDYIPFLNALKKKNYSGWLVVEAEQDPAKANPFEYAKIGFNYLSKTAKQCGFKLLINGKQRLVHYYPQLRKVILHKCQLPILSLLLTQNYLKKQKLYLSQWIDLLFLLPDF